MMGRRSRCVLDTARAIAQHLNFLVRSRVKSSGSFKSRGVGHYLATHIKQNGGRDAIHFYCSSGGNAGLACVVAARQLGFPATIVVPMTCKPLMLEKLRTTSIRACMPSSEVRTAFSLADDGESDEACCRFRPAEDSRGREEDP